MTEMTQYPFALLQAPGQLKMGDKMIFLIDELFRMYFDSCHGNQANEVIILQMRKEFYAFAQSGGGFGLVFRSLDLNDGHLSVDFVNDEMLDRVRAEVECQAIEDAPPKWDET